MSLAIFLRLYKIDFQSLWMDEIYTLNVTNPKFSLTELNQNIYISEAFPYLYYYLLRLVYFFFGYSALIVRLVSAISGICTVYYIYSFGKHLFIKSFGLIASFLLAINEVHIQYSQEARPYALYILFTVLAFYRLSIFIKNTNLKNALWYAFFAALMLNFNFFALLNLFSQGLILLAFIIIKPKSKKINLFKLSALSLIIALLLFVHNIPIIKVVLNYTSFWVPAPTSNSFLLLFSEFLGSSETTVFIFGTLILYFFVVLFNSDFQFDKIKNLYDNALIYTSFICFFWFIGFFSIVMVKSYIGTSVILLRYFLSLLPVLILIISMGLHSIKNSITKIGILLIISIFTIINLTVIKKYYSLPHKSQYREVSQFIIKNNTNNVPVYTSLKNMYGYYLNDETNILIKNTLEGHIREMMADSTKIAPFWYADAHVRPYALSNDYEAFLNKYFTMDTNFNGFDAWTRYYSLKNEKSQLDIKKFYPLKNTNGNDALYNFDSFTFDGSVLTTWGWAFTVNQDATESRISVVLIKDDVAHQVETQSTKRPDVTASRNNEFDLDNSGFEVKQKLTNIIKPGVYTLGIYIKNSAQQTESLIVTDKIITLP
ncbi:glycosyltransferase family 39 protein [Flavobacterium rhizosphaerae]|uniref:Glycosyltransferase family 39 protein n=1 Tax=Flavobacterium rhizosphaerae TaxID=3163298 RepID=A0ABW8YXY8_9FLAO